MIDPGLRTNTGLVSDRWGDALVRTFAVDTLLPRGAVSSFTSFIYNHGSS